MGKRNSHKSGSDSMGSWSGGEGEFFELFLPPTTKTDSITNQPTSQRGGGAPSIYENGRRSFVRTWTSGDQPAAQRPAKGRSEKDHQSSSIIRRGSEGKGEDGTIEMVSTRWRRWKALTPPTERKDGRKWLLLAFFAAERLE